jgi:hypothetical protein
VSEGKGGFFAFNLCLVWRVDYPLFTFHLDSGLSMQVFLFIYFDLFCFGGELGKTIKGKSSQVRYMFLKEFSIAPHFYPVYALANIVLLWAKGEEPYTQNRTFYLVVS